VGRIVRCLAVAVSAVGAAASLGPVATAQAATRAVTSSADSGRGTLRQALLDARTGDTVTIPAMTITLTSGQLVIPTVIGPAATALMIQGAGARSTIITANGHSRVLLADGGTTLSGVTITGGVQGTDNLCSNGGAGICARSDLALTNSSVRENHATFQTTGSVDGGAGIYSDGGSLILRGDTISGNQVTFNVSTSFSGGGGIYSNRGNTAITNSTIADNSVTGKGSGGAPPPPPPPPLCLPPSCIGLLFRHSRIADHAATATASNDGGGGLYSNGGSVTAASATIANNTQDFPEDVVSASGNGGADIHSNGGAASSSFIDTIVAGAGGSGNCSSPGGLSVGTSRGHNVETDTTCFARASTDLVGDPLLGALQDNGGPTDTMALAARSPAIDFGDNSACPSTDQRGQSRPVNGGTGRGAICDVGAFEYVPGAGEKRRSATTVQCDRFEQVGGAYFQCTATVADASSQPTRLVPSGNVDFALDAGADGAFPQGQTCMLAPSQSGPTAFCSVTYQPGPRGVPAGTQPSLSATYTGDSNFQSSTGQPENQSVERPEPASSESGMPSAPAKDGMPSAPATQGAPACVDENDEAGDAPASSSAFGGIAHAAAFNTGPPSAINPSKYFGVPPACAVRARRGPIDVEKEAKKAYDRGYSASLSGDSAKLGMASSVLGGASGIPGPQAPYLQGLSQIAGLASAVEGDSARNAATRAADPPDPHFTRISAVKAYRIPVTRALRRVPAFERRQLLGVQYLAGRSGALAANATASINRAATAHARHRAIWERRQMRADARFSRKLASVLIRQANAMSALTRSS